MGGSVTEKSWAELVGTSKDAAFYIADMAEALHGAEAAEQIVDAIALIVFPSHFATCLLEHRDRLCKKSQEQPDAD